MNYQEAILKGAQAIRVENPEGASQTAETVLASVWGPVVCALCGVDEENCEPGGTWYEKCPLNFGDSAHRWVIYVEKTP